MTDRRAHSADVEVLPGALTGCEVMSQPFYLKELSRGNRRGMPSTELCGAWLAARLWCRDASQMPPEGGSARNWTGGRSL